jgi:ketosteroid isomerase-like protein
MSSSASRTEIAHSIYRAFAAGDREIVEKVFASDLAFHSPPDPRLDREGYFEKCWPGSGNGNAFEFVRTVESGDEVVVTYEATRVDGSRFRNTEVLTFDGEQVTEVEVYFGWDL